MVPLVDEADDHEIGTKPHGSSTQFFALPKPKAKKPPPEPVDTLAKSDPMAGGPPRGGPPGMAPMAAGAVPHMMPAAPMGISGPVANGPVAASPYGPPAGLQGATLPPDPSADINRAQSYRVFAVVMGMMFLAFSAFVVVVVLLGGSILFMEQNGEKETAEYTPPPPPPKTRPAVDTGAAAPPPPPVPTKKPTSKPNPVPKGNPKPQPAKPPPAPAPEPVGPTGTVAVTVTDGTRFTSIEVKCGTSNFRERGSFSGNRAVINNVPRESCTLYFKGGPAAKRNISGPMSLSCSFPNGAVNCN